MVIHKEGYKILTYLFVVLLIVNLAVYYLLPESTAFRWTVWGISAFIYIMILQFFRSPRRLIITNDNHVIAPADGKVVVIEEVDEPEFFNEKRKQVSIFMSPVNVHINRNPISGMVTYFKYHPGKYLVAWHPKSSTENERTTIVVTAKNGTSILLRQIAGALAKRIVWYLQAGEEVKQGEELGFIKFGSRVDVFLPLDAKVKVAIGEKVKGGSTVIAEFK
ncbi:phosphatidylserine decarboxylase [Sporocytophaga myxococcoides]|uniref:Phosphatidylserine decarboxylase proenzyme n=1 Tax=Sporocytophaga myxococcoides TaxID=153721 RepID=A0A098LLW8_9BACT|nr:phosphatidylserine decarboxylase family protein [Sporocytophaga myxococcoides]GAL87317.1 phosphatidylserine decarboxylase [Sporocytophaga myxococcoides]